MFDKFKSSGKAAGIDPVTGKLFTKDIKGGKVDHGKKPPAPKSQQQLRDEAKRKK